MPSNLHISRVYPFHLLIDILLYLLSLLLDLSFLDLSNLVRPVFNDSSVIILNHIKERMFSKIIEQYLFYTNNVQCKSLLNHEARTWTLVKSNYTCKRSRHSYAQIFCLMIEKKFSPPASQVTIPNPGCSIYQRGWEKSLGRWRSKEESERGGKSGWNERQLVKRRAAARLNLLVPGTEVMSQAPAEIRTGNSDGFERSRKGEKRATIRVDPALRPIHPLPPPLTALEPYLADNSSFACSKLYGRAAAQRKV